MITKEQFQKYEAHFYAGTVLLTTWVVTLLLFIDPAVGLKSFTFLMFLPAIVAVIFSRMNHTKLTPFKKKMNARSLLFGIFYPLFFVFLCAFVSQFMKIANWHVQEEFDLGRVITVMVTLCASLFAVFGEEYGWRGYLLPKLTEQYGKVKATTIVGIVWAVYHAPAVYLLAKTTGMDNPLLLCLIQSCVVFTISFAISYCYYLSGNLLPVMLYHAIWNVANTTVLGDIYTNEPGMMIGNLLLINAEGVLGLIIGTIFIFWFYKRLK